MLVEDGRRQHHVVDRGYRDPAQDGRDGLVLRCALMFACDHMLNYGMITGVSSAIPLLVNAVGVVVGGWLMSRWFDRGPRRLVVSAVLLVPMLRAGSTTAFTVSQALAMFAGGLAAAVISLVTRQRQTRQVKEAVS